MALESFHPRHKVGIVALQFPKIINIYMELKLMPCMLTDPGFMFTVVPSGYLCRDIWWSPAAEKSTRGSKNPITWCGGHMIGVAEASHDEGPAIGCWMLDS